LDGVAEDLVAIIDPVTRRPRSLIDPSLIATFDSNTVASATSSPQLHAVGVNHKFDFGQNAYYVKIRVKRDAGSTTNPAAFIVRLSQYFSIGG
jgi:hypothetical protein